MSQKWQVSLRKNYPAFKYNSRSLKKIINLIMSERNWTELPISVNSLSILLCSDSYIHRLNLSYRGKDKPTDVLSFSQIENQQVITGNELGDVVISLDTAKKQAKEYKHSLDHELLRLTIHGILHLAGYDHVGVTKAEATRMRRLEKKLFNEYQDLLS